MAISHKRKIMAAATGDEKKAPTNCCRTRKRSTKRPVKAGRKKHNPPPWSNLHIDIASLIMKQLSLADRIRARAVCKNWLLLLNEIEISRVVGLNNNNNKDKLPWIMSFEWRRTYAGRVLSTCRLHDPCYDKKRPYVIEEDITTGGTRDRFVGATICASKQGWVMFYHHSKESRTCCFCLYSPFTKEVITLPDFSVSYSYPVEDKYVYPYFSVATFSSTPTSSDCVVFVLEGCDHEKVSIRTCRCSDKTWKAHEFFHDGLGTKHIIYKDAVYLDGSFYCVSSAGTLAAFGETRHDWTQLTGLDPLPGSYSKAHLVESDGELLLLVYGRLIHGAILVYAFDKSQKAWFRKQELGNRAIFLGDRYSSYSVSAPNDDIANNVYFHDHTNTTNFYSFKDGNIRECCGTGVYGWVPMEGIQRIWIQPRCS